LRNIVNSDIFALISPSDIGSINKLTLILKIICQCDVKAHYDGGDKNNNVSFEHLDIHYHCGTRCDIRDNVCLNLQN